MKRIRLRTAQGDTPEDVLDWRDQLLVIARAPLNRESLDYEELDRSVRLLKAIKGTPSGEVLELEDADHDHLVAKVKAARWVAADERVADMVRTVLGATDVAELG